MLRIAAVLSWIAGLGFGLPGVYGAVYLAEHGEPWTFLGFPTYGDGPFESWGIDTSTGLVTAFVAVCAAEVALGVLLWLRVPAARWLSLGLLPVELVFWVGFALPVGLLLGPARAALALVGAPARRPLAGA